MKCPRCQVNHKRKAGMTCACGNRFVFDPKVGFYFTDARFGQLVRRASAGGTRWFTARQLEAAFLVEYQRMRTRDWVGSLLFTAVGVLVLGGLGTSVLRLWSFAVAFVAVLVVSLVLRRRQLRQRPQAGEFDLWLSAWRSSYGPVQGLLTEPSLSKAPNPTEAKDVFDYGVQHLLFVDEDLMVDFLVRNGWAPQHHCLVVSERGYPAHIATLARRFLSEQPDLAVWLMHVPGDDAMEARLRRDGWPLGEHPVRDLGLTRDTVNSARFVKQHLPGIDARAVAPSALPPALLLSALTASVAAGAAFEPLLSQAGFAGAATYLGFEISSSSDDDSDFG